MPTNPPPLRPPEIDTRNFLRYYARWKRRRDQPVFCLQVGANDGVTNDPLHPYLSRHGWGGLLVEPLVDVFENELKATYRGNPRVILENVALAYSEGALPLYRVAISDSRWATGLSSFRRESIEGHVENGYVQRKARQEGSRVPDDPDEIIDSVDVPTLTVDQLLAKHGVGELDVLCVDTEGYDFEILKLVDFARLAPEVVLFESKNLSDADYREAQELLRGHGYSLFWERGDTLATTVDYPQHARLWARLDDRLRASRVLVRRVLPGC
jgi:FkbM family methyltransferase